VKLKTVEINTVENLRIFQIIPRNEKRVFTTSFFVTSITTPIWPIMTLGG